MKKKENATLPLILLGSTFLLLGAVTYFYLNSRLEEEDFEFDLWDEDMSDYA
jgi:hypothetical protein